MILNQRQDRTWTETGFPGVHQCSVWDSGDAYGGYLTKFEAGARFPRHQHEGWEQILVVQGAIRFNDVEMGPGDVLQVEGSDEHQAIALEETVLFVAYHGGIQVTE